jgi:hypothetical protein
MTKTLSEPLEIARFWKNRRGEAIVVRLSEYEGHQLVDARTWFTAADGTLKPGKGLACAVRQASSQQQRLRSTKPSFGASTR